MAIPTLHTNYTTRKNIYEAAIIRRRDQEDIQHRKWSERADYFHKSDVQVTKERDWTSERSFQNSMNAYRLKNAKRKDKEEVQMRRRRLADMLENERFQYEKELKLANPRTQERLFEMKDRVDSIKSAREEKRKQLAEDLLYEHFRQNNPDLREIEREQVTEEVVREWEDQVQLKDENQAADQYEDLVYDEMGAARQEEERREDERRKKKREKEQLMINDVLQRQIEEIRIRDHEAEDLQQQEAALLRHQQELEQLNEDRKRIENERKKRELGRALLRQHTAALRRRSKMVQEDLAADLRFLDGLAIRERQDKDIRSARRDKAKSDAEVMRKLVEEQLRVEKAREAELDDLFQEEASRLWAKREEEWKKESLARQRLMEEVMAAREQQLQDQLEANRIAQEESLRAREDLIEELEEDRHLTRREEAAKVKQKHERRAALKEQITEREHARWEDVQRRQDEADEEVRAEKAYEEMLRREAERIRGRSAGVGYQSRSARRGTPRF